MAPHVPLSVKLTRKPAVDIHVTTAAFAWTHKGVARTTTCRIDAATVHPCTAGHVTYKNLKVGRHTFVLKLTGSPNRTLTYHFLIDRTRPQAADRGHRRYRGVEFRGLDAGHGLGLERHRRQRDAGLPVAYLHERGHDLERGLIGNPRTVTNDGQTIVQFRALDKAGNVSAWVPGTAGANNEVWLDHTAPSDPTLTGGSTTWKNVASETLNVSGSTDTGGSGFAGYRYQTSTDNGVTWSVTQIGTSLQVSSEGETLVRFHAVDNIGNWSAWVTGTVRIDRTSPTNPVVTGAHVGLGGPDVADGVRGRLERQRRVAAGGLSVRDVDRRRRRPGRLRSRAPRWR